MDLNQRFTELTGWNISHLIHSVVEAVADKSSYSLDDSLHSPNKGTLDHDCHQISGNKKTFTPSSSPSPSSPTSHLPSSSLSPLSSNQPHIPHSHLKSEADKANKMSPSLADVDDTAAFMVVARTFKMESNYGQPPVTDDCASDGAAEDHDASEAHTEPAETHFESVDGFEPPAAAVNDELIEFSAEKDDSVIETLSCNDQEVATSNTVITINSGAHTPVSQKLQEVVEENRENLTTFKSWGAPETRDKPAAQTRRVIIKDLPSSWTTPDKVLSLIHGGVIESISVTAAGNAHVLFCDFAACRAFYDKYPNGIDLDKERKFTAFVEIGKEVDVVSSQLSFHLSVGSTRVVRAVGVDMEVTMSELVKIATIGGRKVEKIIDSFVPGFPRSVNFRFCSIDDAVRFRGALVRNEDWEHCNVQYNTDPCEVATGYHAD
ncbi:hypothetical protein BJX99DRAFT_228126 [Aspergillus californicus]